MQLLKGLNRPQAAAAGTLSGPLLVLAGAGTGKTRVVTVRIANLIAHGVAPERILAVTFTNKAAKEMRERVGGLLPRPARKRPGGQPDSPRPLISTFHSHCVKVLRGHAKRLGYPVKFSIYDRADQESIARDVLRELRLPTTALKPGDMLAIVSGWKSQAVWPDEAGSIANSDREHLAASAYRRYQDALVARGAMDFDDLLIQTERLFREHDDVRQIEANKFDHVLIDEYQDTNGSQYRITKHLVQEHRNLCVVGDDDQSIYAWRGADVSHILNFKKDWPDATVVYLEDNYRSTAEILTMANRLIDYNADRHDKRLIASRPKGPRPRISQFDNESAEAETVVAEIRKLIDRDHIQPKHIAILFRTNEQPRLFETELRKADVPYVMLGTQSFFDRREIRDLLSYLKWIEQPSDEVNLRRIINLPARGLGPTTIKRLTERAVKRGLPLWEIMCDLTETADLKPAARSGIDDLRSLADDVRHRADNESLTEATQTLLDRTGYLAEIASRYDDPLERESRISSIGELMGAIGSYQDGRTHADLTGFLSDTALAGNEMGSEKDKLAQQNAVWLLTLHAAKGLEFPVVYMVGMEEGLLPHSRSVKSGEETDIAEERRLCYVGITRAQEQLTLSIALTRRKWGKPRPTTPSRFLYEIIGKADNPNQYRKRKR